MDNNPSESAKNTVSKSGSSLKIILPAFLGLVVLVFVIVGGGLFVASRSESNIPVFSDAVEGIERAVVSNDVIASQVQKEVSESLPGLVAATVSNNELNETLGIDDANKTQLKSFNFDVDLQSDFESGSIDVKVNNGKKGLMDGEEAVSLDYVVDADLVDNTSELRASQAIDVSGSLVSSEKTIYFLASKFPLFNVPALDGKWITLENETIEQGIPQNSEVIDTEVIDELDKLINSEAVKRNFRREPDRTFGSVRANCFSIKMDSKALKELDAELASEDSPSVEVGSNDKINMYACVSRVEKLPYLIEFDAETTATNPINGAKSMNVVKLVVNISNHNTDIKFSKPADALTMKQFEAAVEQALLQQFMQEESETRQTDLKDDEL